MMHFSCDFCGQPVNEERFVVKIEVFPAHSSRQISEEDLDIDSLEMISELLDGLENELNSAGDTEIRPRQYRYDLCSGCHKRYQSDPLGRDVSTRLNFSQN